MQAELAGAISAVGMPAPITPGRFSRPEASPVCFVRRPGDLEVSQDGRAMRAGSDFDACRSPSKACSLGCLS